MKKKTRVETQLQLVRSDGFVFSLKDKLEFPLKRLEASCKGFLGGLGIILVGSGTTARNLPAGWGLRSGLWVTFDFDAFQVDFAEISTDIRDPPERGTLDHEVKSLKGQT